jgi:hypothetical protein
MTRQTQNTQAKATKQRLADNAPTSTSAELPPLGRVLRENHQTPRSHLRKIIVVFVT